MLILVRCTSGCRKCGPGNCLCGHVVVDTGMRLRAHAPVTRVTSVGRTFLSKAADTRFAKENPDLFSTNDPNTPMKRAFHAHTLMRKDGEEHLRERMAMAPAFSPTNIKTLWVPSYEKHAVAYLDRLPRDALLTILYGLLTSPDQLEALKKSGNWKFAFEEGVRWVAPIQASSRVAREPLQIRGIDIAESEIVMTIQASANHGEDICDEGEKFNVFRERRTSFLTHFFRQLRINSTVDSARGQKCIDVHFLRHLRHSPRPR